jgi:hypothetical protein
LQSTYCSLQLFAAQALWLRELRSDWLNAHRKATPLYSVCFWYPDDTWTQSSPNIIIICLRSCTPRSYTESCFRQQTSGITSRHFFKARIPSLPAVTAGKSDHEMNSPPNQKSHIKFSSAEHGRMGKKAKNLANGPMIPEVPKYLPACDELVLHTNRSTPSSF